MKALLFSQIFPSAHEPTRGPYNLEVFREVSRSCEARVVSPRPWWSRARRPYEIVRTPTVSMKGVDCSYPTYWSLPGKPTMHAAAMDRSLGRRIAAMRRDFPFDAILAAWMYPDGVTAA